MNPPADALNPIAAKPLFRDPIHDGAADPVVVWNVGEQRPFLLYTNRRADLPAADSHGVDWVHGTRIGIADSVDGGATWRYRGVAELPHEGTWATHWAPEVICHDGIYHMYLTVVPGVFADWNHPRHIVHLTSSDLMRWQPVSTLALASPRVIDACVLRLPGGGWRMWYNNEDDGKSIYRAESPDLYEWTDGGKVVGDEPCEGPTVFVWQGWYWMITDAWKGLIVYRSRDALAWERQPGYILGNPGTGCDDGTVGLHGSVTVSGDRAYLFYFTHPGRVVADLREDDREFRRSSLQVAELECQDGRLACARDRPVRIRLESLGAE